MLEPQTFALLRLTEQSVDEGRGALMSLLTYIHSIIFDITTRDLNEDTIKFIPEIIEFVAGYHVYQYQSMVFRVGSVVQKSIPRHNV